MTTNQLKGFAAGALLFAATAAVVGCSGDGDPLAPPGNVAVVTTPTAQLDSPLLPDFWVDGVWCFNADQFVACGDRGFVTTYDRGAWRSFNTGVELRLWAVWGRSLDDFYVAGQNGIVMHWDGTSFTEIDVATTEDLYAIWGSSAGDVWVCGNSIAVHLAGNSVATYTPTTGLPSSRTIRGVHGSEPKNVYAVASGGLVMRWDGTEWTAVTTGLGSASLNAVYVEGNAVFIAADNGTTWEFDGAVWSAFDAGTTDDFDAIAGNGRGVFAFGENGLMYGRRGGTWDDMSGTFPFAERDILTACANASGVYIAGAYRLDGTVLHFDGIWSELPAPRVTSENLYDVWTFEADDAYAFGGGGTIVHRDAAGWNAVNHGVTTERLYAAWASGRDNIYAAGADGTVMRYDGAVWRLVNTGLGTETLNDIDGNGPDNIWIVGDRVLWHWDGASWTDRQGELPDQNVFYESVCVAPDNTVYLGGDDMLRYNGTGWTSIPFRNNNVYAYDLWGTSSNSIWVAGDDVFGHCDGNDFSPHLAEEYHYAVTGSSDDNLLVTAENHIIHLANGLPTLISSLHNSDMVGGSMGADGTAYFVGNYGEIVRVE